MADYSQCDNCGAMLTEEDVFCGECGMPRPQAEAVPEVADAPTILEAPAPPDTAEASTAVEETTTVEAPPPRVETPPRKPPSSPPAGPSGPPEAGWRVAFVVLIVLGALACIAGLAAFIIFGSMFPTEGWTPQEDWAFSAVCCLLPIGGFGAILVGAGAFIWNRRLKDR